MTIVTIFMSIVEAMVTMMMKLWETFVKDCCRRPALACEAKWRVGRRVPEKKSPRKKEVN